MSILCSVLITSYRREQMLRDCIQSFFDCADDKSRVEFLVRMDWEDIDTVKEVQKWMGEYNSKLLIGPRLRGWHNNGEFLTDLSNIAQGQWTWLLNDDSVMEGPGWDTKLNRIPNSGAIVHPTDYRIAGNTYQKVEGGAFPCVPTNCWKAFGWKEIGNPSDTGLHVLLGKNHGWKTEFLEGVTIHHKRPPESELMLNRLP